MKPWEGERQREEETVLRSKTNTAKVKDDIHEYEYFLQQVISQTSWGRLLEAWFALTIG